MLAVSDVEVAGRGGGAELLKADNNAGYFGVCLISPGQPRPYQARVSRGGKQVHLGTFATAEEAALCVARDAASAASVDSGQQEPPPP